LQDRIWTTEKRYVYIFSRVETFLHRAHNDRTLDFAVILLIYHYLAIVSIGQ